MGSLPVLVPGLGWLRVPKKGSGDVNERQDTFGNKKQGGSNVHQCLLLEMQAWTCLYASEHQPRFSLFSEHRHAGIVAGELDCNLLWNHAAPVAL